MSSPVMLGSHVPIFIVSRFVFRSFHPLVALALLYSSFANIWFPHAVVRFVFSMGCCLHSPRVFLLLIHLFVLDVFMMFSGMTGLRFPHFMWDVKKIFYFSI